MFSPEVILSHEVLKILDITRARMFPRMSAKASGSDGREDRQIELYQNIRGELSEQGPSLLMAGIIVLYELDDDFSDSTLLICIFLSVRIVHSAH